MMKFSITYIWLMLFLIGCRSTERTAVVEKPLIINELVLIKQIPGTYVRAHFFKIQKNGEGMYNVGQFGIAESFEFTRFNPYPDRTPINFTFSSAEVLEINDKLNKLENDPYIQKSNILDSWIYLIYIDGKLMAQFYEAVPEKASEIHRELITLIWNKPKKHYKLADI